MNGTNLEKNGGEQVEGHTPEADLGVLSTPSTGMEPEVDELSLCKVFDAETCEKYLAAVEAKKEDIRRLASLGFKLRVEGVFGKDQPAGGIRVMQTQFMTTGDNSRWAMITVSSVNEESDVCGHYGAQLWREEVFLEKVIAHVEDSIKE